MPRTIGIEREWFIMRDGQIVPSIGDLLPALQDEAARENLKKCHFGFELCASQVEDRTKCSSQVSEVINSLQENEAIMQRVGNEQGLHFMCKDFVTEEELGELVVNPFDERHQKIWSQISHQRKVAASQVAAIHIHISVSGEEAVKVLNYCRKNVIDELGNLGDFSQGRRLAAYKVMAKIDGEPPSFSSTDALMEYIKTKGGERDVWDLVRYKPKTGTIEFRMFGATPSLERIKVFAQTSLGLVESVC